MSSEEPVPLGELTHERFAALEGEKFEVSWQEGSATFELIEVTARKDVSREGARVPFSLVFRGPAEPTLGQGTFLVSHERIGTAAIFLVPISDDDTSRSYEACFS